MSESSRISAIVLDESVAPHRGADIEHERRIAVFDLVDSNCFEPDGLDSGPYTLHIKSSDGRLVLEIEDRDGKRHPGAAILVASVRSILRDYSTICETYMEAIKSASRSRIEAIDMGRRGLHNEGSELLKEALAGKIEIDMDTARRLFTLVHALHLRA